MSALARLKTIARGTERGPAPSFAEPHFILAILVIGDAGTIGRQALAQKVGLGEGAIRTLLKKLRHEGIVETNASGCYLTPRGSAAHKSLRNVMPAMIQLGSTSLTVGKTQTALLLRRASREVTDGIEQRDVAMKAGAAGATTYLIRGGRFQIPRGSGDCEKDFPGPAWRKMRKELSPRDGDVVIVSGSAGETSSLVGAISAALTLLN